ncbi:hypothetical protein FACS189430_05850 [Bacteroidia bacterium]|nr:hypothetical protein FACS189430_05850 [Bacteroidia bacterium]
MEERRERNDCNRYRQTPEANFSVSNSAIIYNALVEAAQEVEEGGTITMLKDVTIYDYADVTLTADKIYTIDLGGFTLGSNDENGLIMESGTVTVTNGSITKDILVDGGRLIIENGTYSGYDDAIYCTGGRVTIISGSFTATSDSSNNGCLVEGGGIIALAGGSTADVNPWKNPAGAAAVIVTAGAPVANFSVSNSAKKYETLTEAAQAVAAGGTITMLQDVTAGDDSDIILDMAKTYTIDLGGNTLGSDVTNALEISAGTITLINGTLTSSIFVDGGELVIEDGSYSGEYFAIYALSGKVTIISGSFSYTSEGYALGCLAENGGEIILAPHSTADVDPWKNDSGVTVVTITAATTYGVSIAALSNGSVSADKADYEAGETVTLTIAPDAGYELDGISTTPSLTLSGTGNTRTFVMPAYDVTVAATFNAIINAATPTISGQPQGSTVSVGGSASLNVTASVSDGGALSYQWYRNAANSNTGGTAVGSNSSIYAPSTAVAGTLYYYVEITNTNNSVNGVQTATVTSSIATVTVIAGTTGVEDKEGSELSLYPNPFIGSIQLKGAEGSVLQVITVNGTVVHTQKLTSPDEIISLEKLPAGLYLFRIEKDGKARTLKAVKR